MALILKLAIIYDIQQKKTEILIKRGGVDTLRALKEHGKTFAHFVNGKTFYSQLYFDLKNSTPDPIEMRSAEKWYNRTLKSVLTAITSSVLDFEVAVKNQNAVVDRLLSDESLTRQLSDAAKKIVRTDRNKFVLFNVATRATSPSSNMFWTLFVYNQHSAAAGILGTVGLMSLKQFIDKLVDKKPAFACDSWLANSNSLVANNCVAYTIESTSITSMAAALLATAAAATTAATAAGASETSGAAAAAAAAEVGSDEEEQNNGAGYNNHHQEEQYFAYGYDAYDNNNYGQGYGYNGDARDNEEDVLRDERVDGNIVVDSIRGAPPAPSVPAAAAAAPVVSTIGDVTRFSWSNVTAFDEALLTEYWVGLIELYIKKHEDGKKLLKAYYVVAPWEVYKPWFKDPPLGSSSDDGGGEEEGEETEEVEKPIMPVKAGISE
jgi:hypothetical protein